MCPSGSTVSAAADLLPDIRSAFDILDVDRDGKISCDDLRSFYSGLYGSNDNNATKEMDVCSMISVADSNKDGFVEFDEFQQVLNFGSSSSSSKENEVSPVLADVFRTMDRDGDGKVGFADLKSYMEWAGFPVSDEDINNMIKVGGGGGGDADGVSYQGLLNILALDSFARV